MLNFIYKIIALVLAIGFVTSTPFESALDDSSVKRAEKIDEISHIKLPSALTWANQAWGVGKNADRADGKDVVLVDGFDATEEEITEYKTKGITVRLKIGDPM
eukprot:Awhi_evm2s13717